MTVRKGKHQYNGFQGRGAADNHGQFGTAGIGVLKQKCEDGDAVSISEGRSSGQP